MQTKFAIILLALLAAGCPTRIEKPDIRKLCRQPGSEHDMRCARPTSQPPQDLVKICERRGGFHDERDCYYINRQELEYILRQMGRMT